MPRRLFASLISLLAALLPGCDAVSPHEFKPGITTAEEVRQRMGPPGAEHADAGGGFTWEYNRQPEGVETHMLAFDAARVLLRIEQVLVEERFARLAAGMNRDEVRRLLGAPGKIERFPLTGEEVWDWRFAGGPANEEWHFLVHFDASAGHLLKTSRMRVQRG